MLEDMRKHYYDENKETTLDEKKIIIDKDYREHIEPLIYKTMKRCTEILKKYPHLESINLDINRSFMKFVGSTLKEYGFVYLTNTEELKKELLEQYPDSNVPKDRRTRAVISRDKIIEYVKNREDKQKFDHCNNTSFISHVVIKKNECEKTNNDIIGDNNNSDMQK